jgi:thioredoxin reductase
MRVTAAQYYALAAAGPDVARRIGELARERIGGLQNLAAEVPKARAIVLGHRWDSACYDLRRFLARNQVSFDWLTPDDPDLPTRWPDAPGADDCPALRLTESGQTLLRPEPRRLAECLGLQTVARRADYDTVIIGGGPAGLAAAVYGASEGLATLVVEREAPGGQAGTSSRIENYLGFPNGVSGDELASRALQQARRLGAEILVTRAIVRLDPAARAVHLDGGDVIRARTIIIATGVTWRRLAIEGFDRFIGRGVWYGAARSEASNTQNQDVFLIGAGNSAGQAALFFANHARQVTLIVRGSALEKTMSRYLIEQVRAKANIAVDLGSEVEAVHGDSHLTAIDIRSRGRRRCRAARVRRAVRVHRRRRRDRMAAGRHRARRARLPADRRRRVEVRPLDAGPRSAPAGDQRPRHVRVRRRAFEPGQARRLRRRRGQHGDRVRAPVPGRPGAVARPAPTESHVNLPARIRRGGKFMPIARVATVLTACGSGRAPRRGSGPIGPIRRRRRRGPRETRA